MRILFAAVVAAAVAGLLIVAGVFRPPPAATRLAGVTVVVQDVAVDDLPGSRHTLRLQVRIVSARDIDECLGFTLDEPFAGRRLGPASGDCLKPRRPDLLASLVFDRLTDDDVLFPAHTLVWGIPGGRCGLVMEAFGVCVVESAGTVDVELPHRSLLPSIGPIGPIFPFGSPSPR